MFIALIIPTLSGIFSAALFLLARHQADHVVERAAWSYAGFAIGMSLQYFEPFGFELSRFLSNAIFLGSMVLLSTALMARHGRRAPLGAMSAITAISLTVLAAGLVGEPNLALRVAAASLGFAAVSALLAYKLWRAGAQTLVDRLLLGSVAFISAGSVIRPAVIFLLQGGLGTEQLFFQSLYWLSLVLSAVFFLSVIALTLISSASLDTIEALRTEAGTDMLSGVFNRRGFEQGAIRLIRKAERQGQPVSLVLTDLDHFKQVNDHFGHACGDAAIRQFAACLTARAGADAVVGRLGGEEFAILASGATAQAARLMAEGMRMGLAMCELDFMPAGRRLTASFGVAQRVPSDTLASLIDRADQALYAAKAAGRDRVRVSAEAEEERDGDEVAAPLRAGHRH